MVNMVARSTSVSRVLLVLFLGSGILAASAAADTVRLDPEIDWPKEMYYLAPLKGAVAGALQATGASDSTVSGAAADEREDELSDVARIEAHDVDFQQIVLGAFRTELEAKSLFDEAAERSLQLNVKLYGFSHKGGFNIDMVPMLKVKATVVDAKGKKVWKGGGSAGVLGKPAARTEYYDLLDSKEAVEGDFEKAADKVAKDALAKFEG